MFISAFVFHLAIGLSLAATNLSSSLRQPTFPSKLIPTPGSCLTEEAIYYMNSLAQNILKPTHQADRQINSQKLFETSLLLYHLRIREGIERRESLQSLSLAIGPLRPFIELSMEFSHWGQNQLIPTKFDHDRAAMGNLREAIQAIDVTISPALAEQIKAEIHRQGDLSTLRAQTVFASMNAAIVALTDSMIPSFKWATIFLQNQLNLFAEEKTAKGNQEALKPIQDFVVNNSEPLNSAFMALYHALHTLSGPLDADLFLAYKTNAELVNQLSSVLTKIQRAHEFLSQKSKSGPSHQYLLIEHSALIVMQDAMKQMMETLEAHESHHSALQNLPPVKIQPGQTLPLIAQLASILELSKTLRRALQRNITLLDLLLDS